MAASQPLVGRLVDTFGAKKVMASGSVLIVMSQLLTSTAQTPTQIYLYLGAIGGLGFGAAANVPSAVLVTNWFAKRRGLAISLAASGLGIGLPLLAVPASIIVSQAGWRTGYLFLGVATLVVLLPMTLLLVRERPQRGDLEELRPLGSDFARSSEDWATPAKKVLRTRSFWLLGGAYTICGFTVTLLDVHLVPMAEGAGVPGIVAAGALGALGVFMSIGLIVTGFVADRVKKKNLLIMSYSVRGAALMALLVRVDPVSLYVVVVVFGLVELATIPPTIMLCRELYGAGSLGTIYGLMFFGHQMGSTLSSYAAGYAYDLTASYSPIIAVSALLAILASLLSWRVDDKKRMKPIAPKAETGA